MKRIALMMLCLVNFLLYVILVEVIVGAIIEFPDTAGTLVPIGLIMACMAILNVIGAVVSYSAKK